MKLLRAFGVLALLPLAVVNASPCPFGQLAEAGKLDEANTAKFFAARANQGEESFNVFHDLDVEKRETAPVENTKAMPVEKRDNCKGLLGLLTCIIKIIPGILPPITTTLGGIFANPLATNTVTEVNKILGASLIGGGLVAGVLQPFTGPLAALDIPTPQPLGIKQIPDAAHPFQYPGPTDVRGPCPGLNVMANHGYISRSGITTFAEAVNGCQNAWGMSYDGCIGVTALGLVTGGDIITGRFSIGGADPRVPGTLAPALGISRHGFFEVDNSMTRQDAYFGNQANFQLDRWNRVMDLANSKYNGIIGKPLWLEERVIAYNESRATNPQFNANAIWLLISNGVRALSYSVFSNGTTPNLPDFASLGPIFLNESFPENWYRHDVPFTVVTLVTEVVSLFLDSAYFTEPGMNVGLGNFIPLGITPGDVTQTAMLCFLLDTLVSLLPGQVTPIVVDGINLVEQFLIGTILPWFDNYNCPTATFAEPGPSQGIPGPSTIKNILINGVYQ